MMAVPWGWYDQKVMFHLFDNLNLTNGDIDDGIGIMDTDASANSIMWLKVMLHIILIVLT